MTVFFDLDGVIVDSRRAIATCIDAALADAGLPLLAAGEVEPLIGPPIVDGFRTLLHTRGRDVDDAVALVRSFRATYAAHGRERTVVVPGIAAIIAELAARHPLAVATSKARDLAVGILEAFDLARWFAAIVGPERDALDETKTTTLARAIALVPAGEPRVMIGDRHHDISAGRANGCRTIGVTWGIGSRRELVGAGADAIVEAPDALPTAIAG